MNDFTKDELGVIICNLCVNPRTKEILIKLGSMIKHYCEHEWKNNCCGCELDNIMCDKCDRAINDNQQSEELKVIG